MIVDVAVRVMEEPEFSAMELELADKLTDGTASSSVIVIEVDEPTLTEPSPPVMDDIEIEIVSLTSDMLSSIGVKVVETD